MTEEENIVQEPQGGEPAAPVAETSPYASLAGRIGVEDPTEEAIHGRFSQLQGELEQAAKAKAEYESRLNGMSPFLLGLNERIAKEAPEADEATIRAMLHDELGRAVVDYSKLAESNPIEVVAKGLLQTGAAASEKAARMLAEERLDGFREHLQRKFPDADDAEIEAKVNERMSIEAGQYVKALEDSKPKLGIIPPAAKTKEQIAQEAKAAQEDATKRLSQAVASVKSVKYGDSEWSVNIMENGQVKPEYAEAVGSITDPWKFFTSEFCTTGPDGNPVFDFGKALQYKLSGMEIGRMVEARVSEARGNGAKTVQDQMQNLNGNGHKGAPNSPTSNVEFGDALDAFLRRQKRQ